MRIIFSDIYTKYSYEEMAYMYDEFDEELDEKYDDEGNVAELCFDHDNVTDDEIEDVSEPESDDVDITTHVKLLKAFRDELEKIEPYRKMFSIVYKGEFKQCKPMKELANERFIVLIDDKLHAVNINDII